jgi:hypothetical protein
MDASMAVNHEAVKERPDHGEEDEHRGEEGDGASGMELIFFAGRYRHFVRYRTTRSSAARAAAVLTTDSHRLKGGPEEA